MKFQDKAKDLFKHHPNATELHFTSDGFAFFGKHDAEAHAQSLQDREIESITRAQVEAPSEEEAPAGKYAGLSYNELKAELKAREVQYSNTAKKQELVELLEANDADKSDEGAE